MSAWSASYRLHHMNGEYKPMYPLTCDDSYQYATCSFAFTQAEALP